MKRFFTGLLSTLAVLSVTAAGSVPQKVQGVAYTPTTGAVAPLAYSEPADMPGDGSFTMDMIQSWTGEGSKRAAMVIQWNDDAEESALVFGFRWDGDATGADMFRAIVSANPQLYGLIQYTNVSSPTDPNGGYTIDGIGWDIDIEGNIALTDRFGKWYESEGGLFIHPRGYVPGESSSIDYDYDDWVSRDKYDRWGAGWYQSYWSYWVKSDQSSNFAYSGWGASGRVLTDGCWDGWNFNVGMATHAWKSFVAAPPIPDGYKKDIVYNDLHYRLKNGISKTVLLADANESTGTYTGDIVVPSTFVDEGITYTVEGVTVSAFADSEATTVSLPSSITEIRPLTFKGSKSLQTITFSGENKVKIVGEGAFDGCTSLTTFLLPQGRTSIGARTYAGTAITSVDIPVEITSIGEEAFRDCSALTEVIVHTVYPLEIADETFGTAANKATLVVPTGYISTYQSATGWSNFANFAEQTIPVNVGDIFPVNGVTYQVTSMDEGALTVMATHCRVSGAASTSAIKTANAGYSGDLVVPEKVVYQGLEFAVTAIDKYAFYYATGLTSMTIEAPITTLPSYIFSGCSALTHIDIPSTVTAIEKAAFSGCTKLEFTLPETVTELGAETFMNCTKITEFNFPGSMTTIPSSILYGCTGLTTVTFGDNVTSIGANAFYGCTSLTNIVIPETVETLGSSVFKNCSKLVSVELPNGLQTIGGYAFQNTAISQLVIPATVTTMAVKDVVNGCPADIKIYMCNPTPVNSSTNTWRLTSTTYAPIIVPAGCVDAYTNYNNYWKKSKISSPELSAVEALDYKGLILQGKTVFSGRLKGTYTMPTEAEETPEAKPAREVAMRGDLPEAFAEGCDKAVICGKTITVKYRFKPLTVYESQEVTAGEDGSFEFETIESKSPKMMLGIAVGSVESKTYTLYAIVVVTDIILGDGSDDIYITYKDILALTPTIEPEDAGDQTFTVSVGDESIASTYSVSVSNPTRQFYELVTHNIGETTLTFTSNDDYGFSRTYNIHVVDPDRTPAADDYQDGTFWLNEEWYGHTNGSINYITSDYDVMYRAYEAQNPEMSFGVTSQYGTIYGNHLIVMSKQASETKDDREGGRLVVADATTLVNKAAFSDIGGDGRACVGAAGKVYLGTTGGIRVLSLEDYTLGDMIDGTVGSGGLYSGQLGDMVASGGYVFAIRQEAGVLVINTATDELEKTFTTSEVNNPQGIVVDCNGNVWVASTDASDNGYFHCISPETLEVMESVALPEGKSVICQWGAWHSSNFFASKKSETLWWGTVYTSWSGDKEYYKWEIGDVTDGVANAQLVYTFPDNLAAENSLYQLPYATAGYDERNDMLLIAANRGYSGNYRYNWLHFINCEHGVIVKTIQLKDYYWFPAMPIFPDKYAPEFGDMPESIFVNVDVAEPYTLDLSGVSDADGIDACIALSVDDSDLSSIADVVCNGHTVTISHKGVIGDGTLSINAESNGKISTVDIPVQIGKSTGVNDAIAAGVISFSENRLHLIGLCGKQFVIYNVAGNEVGAFDVESEDVTVSLALVPGAYIVASTDGTRRIKINIQ